EVVSVRSAKSAEWPRDLNLVLLVGGDTPPDSASIRKLVDDRYVCRKFVLCVNGRDICDVLADLPFWPPGDLLSGAPTTVAAGVQEAVRGYDPCLIADLASYSPGAERVFEKIKKDKYNLTGEPSADELVRPPRLAPSVITRLEALDITDFRGIRRLRPEDMPLSGDVVFIYGPNGVGKTSIADAVEWAITGQVGRLQQARSRSGRGGPDPIVNVFSDKCETRVTCRLSNCEPVCRRKRGGSVERLIGSHSASNDRPIIDHVVGTKAPSREARLRIPQLRALFRSSHMLSQHDIRQFLEETNPVERFDILTNMIGAEEFVRFREKVATVLRHLRAHVRDMAEQSKSLKHELEDLAKRLSERKKELESLSRAVTADKTPEDLASELLQGLRNCQCTINEATIERADAEPAERRIELIAVHAETAIRGKKAATQDLLMRLKSLEQELQGYIEARTRCESLVVEIASAKSFSEKTRPDLEKQEKARQDIQKRLRVLGTKRSEAARRSADLTWLKENLAAYHQNRDALRRMEDSLADQREELKRSEAALEEQQKSLSAKRARLQECEQAIATKTKRGQALTALMERLSHVQTRLQEAEKSGNKERQLNSQIGELKRQASSTRSELNATRARLDELERAYKSEAARHDVLNSFLAKLGELVNSAKCPLCGRSFLTTEEAKDTIREHLSAVPLQLRNLARRLDEAKKEADAKQTQADSIAAGIRALQAETEQARAAGTGATKVVEDFVADCAALAVTVSVDDAGAWQNALERALRESEVPPLRSEAASLRDAINKLASHVVQQQNMVDELQRKLTQNEKQRNQLVTVVQGIETDMVQRGFEPGSLPDGDQLAAEVSKAQEESNECSKTVAKKKAELGGIEPAIAELRENLKRADEDVASKETQLRQYETTCNRFVAACRAMGVTPENPRESILSVKRRASDMNQSLSDLEGKCQVLQQIAALGRLKREIDGLARAEGDVKKKAEESSGKVSQLRNWMSHVEGLEAEVIRRQVDVVGIHLERLEPTMQRLYHRMNAHPIFGKVRIRVNDKTREFDVEAEASVAHEWLGDIAVSPSVFFSDAQMNSLAITVFLAGALQQRWSGFNTILIDDPVQQMDEMNVCAFLDLIRGLSRQQQFIIFTCSRDFYMLALDKLVCLNKSKQGSFLAYRLEGIVPAELKVCCDAP
ncbi:MAG: SMC family ATPase, partial [Desulfobacterales bacterium]|nr:SMC family ATPase [Desulfobacterales bacterium]